MTLDELAWEYCWEKRGDMFILPKAGGEFQLDKNGLCFVCACCGRKTVIKTCLSETKMKGIIKCLGKK